MFMRSTAMGGAMMTTMALGGAAFMAGAAAGAGLTLAALGTAMLARRAMERRSEWGGSRGDDAMASGGTMTTGGEDDAEPGLPEPA